MDRVLGGVKQMSIDDHDDGFDPDEIDDTNHSTNNYEDEELPNVLIITSVDDSVFENTQSRAHFEAVFRDCDSSAEFYYLKSFRRARIVFSSSLVAAQVKIQLHEAEICGKRIKLYFAMPLPKKIGSSPHLQPPEPEKQFLISPPASPPVGWEPANEARPIINYELLNALAKLQPGEAHEVHPASASQPGIVVHICEDPEGFSERPTILQTRCPERLS